MMPSEYFRRQMYAYFWFERRGLGSAIERLGIENCTFETDLPHPTCLYPNSRGLAAEALAGTDDAFCRRVLSSNAAGVYQIAMPDVA
jgi:uncharacterized protein